VTNSRERLAWAILLASFVLCVGLAAGVPLGVRALLRTACTVQDAVLEPQRGTPRVQRRGRGEIIALIGPTWDVPPGTVVTTDGSAQGLLTLYVPDQELAAVAAVQVYGDTEVALVSARSPRFDISPLPHRVALEVRAGRVRVRVARADERDTVVELQTSHMTALLGEGSYEVRVRPALSELTVREGNAQVRSTDGEAVALVGSQRTVVRLGATPLEVLPAERNLLSNSNFDQPLEESWEVYHDEQQPPEGRVEATALAGRPAARFYRDGIGHAQVDLHQSVNYDVRDFTSLILHLNVYVREQSLPGCGSLGSECPIIVRIDYKDVFGTDRQWHYGFYSVEHVPPDLLQPWEQQVPLQTWVTFDSGNLVEAFEEPPALIKSVTIYASGHSFDALVTEVELLAQE
jgi:hypothetical protein